MNREKKRVHNQNSEVRRKNNNRNNRNTNPNISPTKSVRRVRKRKKTIERFSATLVSLVIIGFCLYVATSFFRGVKENDIPIMSLETGSVSIPKEFDSIIIRDETVYTANRDGEVLYEIIDGEKVAKNSIVSYIADPNLSSHYNEANKFLNDDELVVKNLTENFTGNKEYIYNLNTNIKNKIDSRNYESFDDFYSLVNYIDYTIQHRNELLLSSSESFDEDKFNENISKSRNPLYSINSGVVTYIIDGYENTYNKESIPSLAKNDIKSIDTQGERKLEITAGEEVFKIIESNTWYVVSYIDNEVLTKHKIEKGKNKKIFLHNGYKYDSYNSKVVNIEVNKKDSKVVFEINEGLNNILNKRFTKLKVDDVMHIGMKVPLSAIKYKDTIHIKNDYLYSKDTIDESKKTVYFSKMNGEIDEVIVTIYKEHINDNYSEVLLSTTLLDEGDIIVKEDNYEDEFQIPKRKQITGVLVVNTGVATFREVFVDKNISSSTGVAILKHSDNPNIREYDKIIEDASLAEEGDIIY